jgi:hypothetical protein
MESDPEYVNRLDALPEAQRRMLRDGDWDVYDGQFFPEFRRDTHVIRPMELPDHWRRFRCMDYGLDMCACYWIAVDPHNTLYVYRELYESNLILSAAAQKIKDLTGPTEKISYTVASRDLWNRNKQTGKSEAETLINAGIRDLCEADNRRIPGWREVREWLTPKDTIDQDGNPTKRPRIFFFDTCRHIIRTLPLLIHDDHDPEDAADEPHEVTHAPEALRYGIMSRPSSAKDRRPTKEQEHLANLDPNSAEYAVKKRMLDKIQANHGKVVRIDQYIKGQVAGNRR